MWIFLSAWRSNIQRQSVLTTMPSILCCMPFVAHFPRGNLNDWYSHYTPNATKICRFFTSEHADLVRTKGPDGVLPIHWLVRCCNRPLVQEIAVLFLKEYPERINAKASQLIPRAFDRPFYPASPSTGYSRIWTRLRLVVAKPTFEKSGENCYLIGDKEFFCGQTEQFRFTLSSA